MKKINNWKLYLAVIMISYVSGTVADSDSQFKREAVSRLVASHDPGIPIALGCIVVKQNALQTIEHLIKKQGMAKGLGPDWNQDVVEWQQAQQIFLPYVEEFLNSHVREPSWFFQAFESIMIEHLNSEEADEIADHFDTEIGDKQRLIIDLKMIAETLTLAYTISRKMKPWLEETKDEVSDLQTVFWDRAGNFRADDELYHHPEIRRFAGKETGRKYGRLIAMQGIGAIMARFDNVSEELALILEEHIGEIDPILETYARRTAE